MNDIGAPRKFKAKPGCDVRIVEVDSLVPHEDVEQYRLSRILRDIKLAGHLTKPIIVDDRKGVVIDGHHRLRALSLLGVRYVPVVEANYRDDIVDVGSWMYVGPPTSLSYRGDQMFAEFLESASKRGNAKILIKLGDITYTINVDRLDIYYAMKEASNSIKISYLTKMPTDMDMCLNSYICITMPKLTVDDIYTVALKSDVLPPRTTYHRTHLKKILFLFPLKRLYDPG